MAEQETNRIELSTAGELVEETLVIRGKPCQVREFLALAQTFAMQARINARSEPCGCDEKAE